MARAGAHKATAAPGPVTGVPRADVPRVGAVGLRTVAVTVTQVAEHVVAGVAPRRTTSRPRVPGMALVGVQPTWALKGAVRAPPFPPRASAEVATTTAYRRRTDEVHRPILGPGRTRPTRVTEVKLGIETPRCPIPTGVRGPLGWPTTALASLACGPTGGSKPWAQAYWV